jgi:hypothetical protein
LPLHSRENLHTPPRPVPSGLCRRYKASVRASPVRPLFSPAHSENPPKMRFHAGIGLIKRINSPGLGFAVAFPQ